MSSGTPLVRGTARTRTVLVALAALAWLAVAAGAPAVEDAAARPHLKRIGTFNQPIYATAPRSDKRRIFVVERGGTIRVVRRGRQLRRPFLRIPGGVSTDGERGLLSMAFAPNYGQSRRFYVFYTAPGGDLRIDEFRRSRQSRNRALRSSRRLVLRIEHSRFGNHNGGQLQFGPDGFLYISTGDGGGGGDPLENGQDRTSLLGKILRIDPRRSGRRPYTVPRGNPFVGRFGRDEIFAYGLRNPFRFSFDRLTGDLAIGDVGQDAREEVDFRLHGQQPGANFGWDCFEGSLAFEGGSSCIRGSPHVRPVLERSHASGDCSIIGGYVARHRTLRALRGLYVYGDLCTGVLRAAKLSTSGATRHRRLGINLPAFSLVSFGEDALGRMYVIRQDGPVSRLLG